MKRILLTNLGTIVTGDIHVPLCASADTIAIADGIIQKIGPASQFNFGDGQVVIDAQGQTAIPGLIDAHVHNGMEDVSTCLHMEGMLEDAFLNGTTTMVSEGEQGPGYPGFYGDREGILAQSIFAHRLYANHRPGGGLKLHAGALVLCDDLTEADFADQREKGVWHLCEVGAGGTGDMDKIRPMVGWARKHGFFISVSLSAPSIPGTTWLDAEDVIALEPDKVTHANGGTTGCAWDEIQKVIDHTDAAIEVIPEGNYLNFNRILQYLRRRGQEHRIVFGSDAPTGACMLAGALNKAIVRASCLNDIPAQNAIAYATGNAARLYGFDTGLLHQGRTADIVVIDAPPGSVGTTALEAIQAGDLFGCSLVIADGRVAGLRGRDTRATARVCHVDGRPLEARNIQEFLYSPRKALPFQD